MSEKDGGSAFPLEVDGWAHHGMTLPASERGSAVLDQCVRNPVGESSHGKPVKIQGYG